MRCPHAVHAILGLGVAVATAAGAAQTSPSQADDQPLRAESDARADWSPRGVVDRLSTPVGVRFHGQPLGDVVRYLAHTAGVPIEAFWTEHGRLAEPVGLDPMTPIVLDARGLSCLEALEAALVHAGEAQRLDQNATWQFVYATDPAGGPRRVRGVEIGPVDRLNHPTAIRAEVYDVADLLAAIAQPDAPARTETIRLNLAPGAPSLAFPIRRVEPGQSPTNPQPDDGLTQAERELIELVTTLVEPAQWVRNGGDAARIGVDSEALVVVAPDYIHRQIAGL